MGDKPVTMALVLAFALILGSTKLSDAIRTNSDTDNVLCNMSKEGLQSCLPSVVRGTSPAPPPSAACCTAISKANIPCLCSFKGSNILSFYGIDTELAMNIPHKCNLEPSRQCP